VGDAFRRDSRPMDPGALVGPLWLAGWLFTIAFAKLAFLKAVLALVLWPWFLGVALRLPR